MDFYLDFTLCKSVEGKDQDGNYLFQVEASNENVDFQDQIVLQSALLGSKDNFLKNGVISYDHLHRRKDNDGNVISDPSMIIGEPVDVWTEGDKTFVKGILYKTNEMAQEVIKLLKAGSTRIRASVGGLFPKVTKENGIEKVVSVLWNDLALTPCPVNNTVGSASFAKSFSASEFAKALSAGSGTDSSNFKGGRALIPEDVETITTETRTTIDEEKDKEDEEEFAKSFVEIARRGGFSDYEDALEFAKSNGIKEEEAILALDDIRKSIGGLNMRKTFSDAVNEICKAMDTEKETDNDELFDFEEEDDEKLEKSCKKSESMDEDVDDEDDEEEDAEYTDASDLVKSLELELRQTNRKQDELVKSVNDLGEALVKVASMLKDNIAMTKSLGEESVPFKSVMNKSVEPKATQPNGKLSADEFKQAQLILCKSVQDGEISAVESSMIERDMQLAMQGKKMKKEYWDFLSKKMGGN